MRSIIVLTVICAVLFAFTNSDSKITVIQDGDEWVVPDKYKNMKNPEESNSETISIGKSVYNKHCKSCHGSKGEGDGSKAAELDTPSGDFTLEEFQEQTDGELFYKTKEGRDDMPSFKTKISSDEDFWCVVNYMRTFGEE